MELERMGEVLATKGMGWHKGSLPEPYCWYDERGIRAEVIHNWTPWDNWPQTGKVIEMMQAAGWGVSIGWLGAADATFYRGTVEAFGMVEGATLAGVCYAVSVAAARALESEGGDEQA